MQGWYDLLFAHWPVPSESLRSYVPPQLAIDTFEGSAWVGITPFHLRMRPRGLPVLSGFPELNCRTYVVHRGKPGIFFFSLDASSRLAVWGARTVYHLPYFHARMKAQKHNKWIHYCSNRTKTPASFVARYTSEGPIYRTLRGSLGHWLTERYCLYVCFQKAVFRGEIHHLPWPIQGARCEIKENGIATASGIRLPDIPPLLNFAQELDVLIWPLQPAE
jgi:uncharacterized protein